MAPRSSLVEPTPVPSDDGEGEPTQTQAKGDAVLLETMGYKPVRVIEYINRKTCTVLLAWSLIAVIDVLNL